MTTIYEWFLNYLQTTPADQIGSDVLIYFGWIPVFFVLVRGFLEVWKDVKQGNFNDGLKWDVLAVTIPQDAVQTPKGMMNLFDNLMGARSSITFKEKWLIGKEQPYFSFEIVSNGGQIQFYIRTQKKYRDFMEAALYAQYPEAQIIEVEDYAVTMPEDWPNEEYDCFGTELTSKKEDYFPIKRYEEFEHVGEKDLRFKDPILPLLEMLGKMRPGENLSFQIIIAAPDEQDWKKPAEKWMKKMYGIEDSKKAGLFESTIGWIPMQMLNQITGMEIGEAAEKKTDDFRMWKLTPAEQDTLKAVNAKTKEIGWQTKIRMVYYAKNEVFRKGLPVNIAKGFFSQFDSGMNKIALVGGATTKGDYVWDDWLLPSRQRRLTSAYKGRKMTSGANFCTLTSSELATIWHFPPSDARTPVLTSLGARMAEAPQELGFAMDETAILPNIERSAPDGEGSLPPLPTAPAPAAEFVPVAPTPVAPTAATPASTEHVTAAPIPVQASVPTPDVPTAPEPAPQPPTTSTVQDQPAFQAGMPAPLPPGLDISDIEVSEGGAPGDLPM